MLSIDSLVGTMIEPLRVPCSLASAIANLAYADVNAIPLGAPGNSDSVIAWREHLFCLSRAGKRLFAVVDPTMRALYSAEPSTARDAAALL
jgi:hypothetical protein